MQDLGEKNFCPMYVDFVRECAGTFGNISMEINTTIRFCVSKNHVNCPFFKYLNNQNKYCPKFITCDMCTYYKNANFDDFIKITSTWCVSNNFDDCARFKSVKAGVKPSEKLMPDGNML
ncbi:MAG: hypothetical protein KKD05_01355 [Candidatus Omnitrophica bacterium]|nr:hypothetical protein [Candidatus Omnitrophota bacterium]